MLQLRPNCECCDHDLAPDSTEAWICSFEGELVMLPRRPADKHRLRLHDRQRHQSNQADELHRQTPHPENWIDASNVNHRMDQPKRHVDDD
jgi:hypothetical protein